MSTIHLPAISVFQPFSAFSRQVKSKKGSKGTEKRQLPLHGATHIPPLPDQTGKSDISDRLSGICSQSESAARSLALVLKLAQSQSPLPVLDLAASSGIWGITIAQQSLRVHVTAIDWAGVMPITQKNADQLGLSDRFRYIEGDVLRVDLGTGYQLAMLGHILYGENESHCRNLIRRVFKALVSGGTIAVALQQSEAQNTEWLFKADCTPCVSAAFFSGGELVASAKATPISFMQMDLDSMRVNFEAGVCFSFADISSWLKEAGFVDVRAEEASCPLILATKP